jgi:hypothetical protein
MLLTAVKGTMLIWIRLSDEKIIQDYPNGPNLITLTLKTQNLLDQRTAIVEEGKERCKMTRI